jgi:hypothetical protein
MLRSIKAYGVRGDAEKAQKFYGLAAVAGIEKASERLEALKSSSPPDAVPFGGRTAQHKRAHKRVHNELGRAQVDVILWFK